MDARDEFSEYTNDRHNCFLRDGEAIEPGLNNMFSVRVVLGLPFSNNPEIFTCPKFLIKITSDFENRSVHAVYMKFSNTPIITLDFYIARFAFFL